MPSLILLRIRWMFGELKKEGQRVKGKCRRQKKRSKAYNKMKTVKEQKHTTTKMDTKTKKKKVKDEKKDKVQQQK